MSELRWDPIYGRWVVLAVNRSNRPRAFVSESGDGDAEDCPFCEFHEDQTPRELFAIRDDDPTSPHPWRVRVVDNKYPALTLTVATAPDWLPKVTATDELRDYTSCAGVGSHEVIIESPTHVCRNSEMTADQLRDVLAAYQARLNVLREDPRIRCAVIFKNVGAPAGATLEHVHSQLIALPFVPPLFAAELQGAQRYYELHGQSVFQAMLEKERHSGQRVVSENERFVVFCPYASRTPYEMWVMARAAGSHFEAADAASLDDLASSLHDALCRLDEVLDRPAYNYVIHSGPFDTQNLQHYHWYVEVVPRVTKIAGFEWASGCAINVVAPEVAAQRLRSVSRA
ncbi:MAG: DUF4921 family protein [Planctomycetota bacterium]|nr:MAG: DUF4921 family protein [Planctomycetota bacterium]REK42431.1 MAG: DUF4921 family protein [Planctomycetota bacterium]